MNRLIDVKTDVYGPGMHEGIRKHIDLHKKHQVPIAEKYGLELSYTKGSKAGEIINIHEIKTQSKQAFDGTYEGAQLLKFLGIKNQSFDLGNSNTKRIHLITQVIPSVKNKPGTLGRFNVRRDWLEEMEFHNFNSTKAKNSWLISKYKNHAQKNHIVVWLTTETNKHFSTPIWEIPDKYFIVTYRNKDGDRLTIDWKSIPIFFLPEKQALPLIVEFTQTFYQRK